MLTDRPYYESQRKEMVRFLPPQYERVLEIGCGEGNFAANLRTGCEIWGVEPNTAAAEIAAAGMHRVLVGKYDQCSDGLPNTYFDLVICNDVIEHVEDHDTFLDSIWQKTRPDGYLVGSVPNVRYYSNLKNLLLRRDWRYTDAGILDKTHLRFFTSTSMQRALTEHAFSIERFDGIKGLEVGCFGLRSALRQLVVTAIVLLTFGYYSDMCFLQFGFRARKTTPSNRVTGGF